MNDSARNIVASRPNRHSRAKLPPLTVPSLANMWMNRFSRSMFFPNGCYFDLLS